MAFPVVYRPSNGIWQGSTTATTGGTVTLNVAAAAGKLNFRNRYANSATGVPLELQDSTSGVYEFSYGTLTYGAGPTSDTISSRVITFSSNGVATPVAWGAGTRNAWCNVAAESFLFKENALAEMNSTELAHALANLGIVFGTATGNVPQLVFGGLPAVSGENLTSLPPYFAGGLIQAYTGGSNSKICRSVSYNSGTGILTVTEATAAGATHFGEPAADTPLQLRSLWCRGSDGRLYRSGSVVPFASVVANQEYYLGSVGAALTAPLSPDFGNIHISIGLGLATGVLYFDPRPLVAPDTGSARMMTLDGGHFAAT